MDDLSQGDICRVCRCEGQSDRPLFYPCICTGSIKYIHQDCLMQWMRYSRKEYCELCGHRFSFTPIYSPDMPRVLPLRDVAGGLVSSVGKAVKNWSHYSLVAFAWLGVVPISAYRTYKFMFSGSFFESIVTLSFDAFSTENIASDIFRGFFVVLCTLLSFIGLVWLREQILHGGGPDWLERDEAQVVNEPRVEAANAAHADVPGQQNDVDENNDNNNNENNNNEVNVEADQAPVDVPIDNAEPPPAEPEEAIEDQDIANGNEEANWNPMEWDRAAEDLTWERLLGLDGSMVFIEHVFWVVSLNTICIFTFAVCPYCIGNFVINWLGLLRPDKPLIHFHGLITTLFGYCNIGLTLVVLHCLCLRRMRKIRWLLGLCYIVVKVALLSVVEIGVLPLICGWWLDICSLPMFDATIKDRQSSFRIAPGTSLFIHWMFGMVYVYYFAGFISVLREVLRPGILWFLRNLNDPDFNPIQEMIHLSILRHIRRLIASTIIFGSVVILVFWLPIQILKTICPTFLPYTISGDSEVNELSLHLMLLQVILPGFFEQSHNRVWLKAIIRLWCTIISWVLGIRSYLLGYEVQQNGGNAEENVRAQPQPDRGLGLRAEHHAVFQRDNPIGFQPYDKPSFFPLRVCGLIFFMCVSLVGFSLIGMTVPIWIGRQVMTLWSVGSHKPNHQAVINIEVQPRTHELYTAAAGIYICWVFSRGVTVAVNLLPQGRTAIVEKIKHWINICASYALAAVIFVLMLGVIPLLFGLLLELVLVIPLRVKLDQTPILFFWQDWALGVLYTKIACALTMMGPDWRIKRAIERAYRDGLRDIDLKFIIWELAAPLITSFGMALAIPYVIAHSIVPIFITNQQTRSLISRKIYPFFLVVVVAILVICLQIRQFKKLYIALKNDKYLVGQRLVNYEHRKRKQEAANNVVL